MWLQIYRKRLNQLNFKIEENILYNNLIYNKILNSTRPRCLLLLYIAPASNLKVALQLCYFLNQHSRSFLHPLLPKLRHMYYMHKYFASFLQLCLNYTRKFYLFHNGNMAFCPCVHHTWWWSYGISTSPGDDSPHPSRFKISICLGNRSPGFST
ncbi:Uncharacterized protein HZ326_22725 [Fusarium oxysporum f. sp. albedinis]|nr:Uncharacterized protein HZ326_22725 [Fusarium oxysporum f. sp. albedinis]